MTSFKPQSTLYVPTQPERPQIRTERGKLTLEEAQIQFYKTQTIIYEKITAENIKTLQVQRNLSRILLFIVCVIVFAGIFFSGIQLIKSTRIDAHNFDLDIRNMKITTSAIGLAVLSISLAFFYFYLKEVYPINVIQLQVPQSQIPTE